MPCIRVGVVAGSFRIVKDDSDLERLSGGNLIPNARVAYTLTHALTLGERTTVEHSETCEVLFDELVGFRGQPWASVFHHSCLSTFWSAEWEYMMRTSHSKG